MKSTVSLVMWMAPREVNSLSRRTVSSDTLRPNGLVLNRTCSAMRAVRFEASLYGLDTYSGSEYVKLCLLVWYLPAPGGRDICGAKIAARSQGRIVRRTMVKQEAVIERTRRICLEGS